MAVGLISEAVGGDPEEDEPTAAVGTTTTTQASTTTEAPTTTVEVTTTQAPTTEAPTTTITAPPTTLSDEQIRDAVGPTAVRMAMEESGMGHVVGSAPDEAIRTFGDQTCDLARDQDNGAQLALAIIGGNQIAAENGWSDDEALTLVGAVMGVYCPEELQRLNIG